MLGRLLVLAGAGATGRSPTRLTGLWRELAGAEGFEFTPLNSKSHFMKALPAKSQTKW